MPGFECPLSPAFPSSCLLLHFACVCVACTHARTYARVRRSRAWQLQLRQYSRTGYPHERIAVCQANYFPEVQIESRNRLESRKIVSRKQLSWRLHLRIEKNANTHWYETTALYCLCKVFYLKVLIYDSLKSFRGTIITDKNAFICTKKPIRSHDVFKVKLLSAHNRTFVYSWKNTKHTWIPLLKCNKMICVKSNDFL